MPCEIAWRSALVPQAATQGTAVTILDSQHFLNIKVLLRVILKTSSTANSSCSCFKEML